MMLQAKKADDFVLATHDTHTIREFVEESFKFAGIEIQWKGQGVEEQGIDAKTGKVRVCINPQFFRPAEVELLIGDYSKAKKILGWQPETDFKTLVKIMMHREMERLS